MEVPSAGKSCAPKYARKTEVYNWPVVGRKKVDATCPEGHETAAFAWLAPEAVVPAKLADDSQLDAVTTTAIAAVPNNIRRCMADPSDSTVYRI